MRLVPPLLISYFLVCSTILGCQPHGSYHSVTVRGQVTVGGEPLSGAVITFEPVGGTGGPKASAAVIDGSYRIDSTAQLHPGKFLVRVSMLPPEMLRQFDAQRSMEAKALPSNRVIAAQFDSDSQTTIQLKENIENEFHWQVSFR